MLAFALAAVVACVPATGPAQQRVTVQASSTRATVAVVRLSRRDGNCWREVAGPWTARVGRSGLSAHRREGDGTTPIGTFGFGPVMYGLAPDPGVRFAYHRLVCGDWWDEDPASPSYNSFRHLACGRTPPFRGASEALWTESRASVRFAVIRYNADPVVPGRGSAIFLHYDVGGPTNGCVSLPAGELDFVLRWLDPARKPQIVIMAPA
jgi:L,D-peptidoglycan transpeptidase YkuD (ErfK/YbiS/YcfS/YnhG family)